MQSLILCFSIIALLPPQQSDVLRKKDLQAPLCRLFGMLMRREAALQNQEVTGLITADTSAPGAQRDENKVMFGKYRQFSLIFFVRVRQSAVFCLVSLFWDSFEDVSGCLFRKRNCTGKKKTSLDSNLNCFIGPNVTKHTIAEALC